MSSRRLLTQALSRYLYLVQNVLLEVRLAALPLGAGKVLFDGLYQSTVSVTDDQKDTLQATLDEALKEVRPCRLVLRVTHLDSKEVPFALGVDTFGDQHTVAFYLVVPADLLVAGIHKHVRIRFLQWTIEPVGIRVISLYSSSLLCSDAIRVVMLSVEII